MAGWVRILMAVAVVVAAFLVLAPAANAALLDADQLLRKLWPAARTLDITAAIVVLIIFASAGQVAWLGRAYAFAIGLRLFAKAAVLVKLRGRAGAACLQVGWNVRVRRPEPSGPLVHVLVAFAAVAGLVATRDGPSLVSATLVGTLTLVMSAAGRRAASKSLESDLDAFELLPSSDLSVGQVQVRPGNVLVAVRTRGSCAHVAAALQAAGDRDVVVMTARLLGSDVEDDPTSSSEPTPSERHLFSEVLELAERYCRPVSLLIVPTQNVFDAAVATILRLQSSELFVGESSSLSSGEQARLLGEAWERAEKPEGLDVRFVIHHNTGASTCTTSCIHPHSLPTSR